jgi:DNA polymerase-3 subunit epsilon
MYNFIYDVETTGLPIRINRRLNYNNLESFNNCRLISISWIITDNINNIIEKGTYYVKPDNFEVSQESINIHGLTNQFLEQNGESIHNIIDLIKNIFTEKYEIIKIVSHNIDFDINVLKSELVRYNYSDLLIKINDIETYCTMLKSQSVMRVNKWPKLSEAYRYFYDEDITNAHQAEYDTLYCYKIFKKLSEI